LFEVIQGNLTGFYIYILIPLRISSGALAFCN